MWKCENEFEDVKMCNEFRVKSKNYEPICITTMMRSLRRTLVRFVLYSTSINHIET